MSQIFPSLPTRFFLAFVAFFKVLLNSSFAYQFTQIRVGELPQPTLAAEKSKPDAEPISSHLKQPAAESALQILSMLQREGRFVDFLQEDIDAFSNEQIGAAVRVVHRGCKKVLTENFTLVPVHEQTEGSQITVEAGFKTDRIRLTGNLVGEPPFRGVLQHRGWEVAEIKLPQFSKEHNFAIIAPAEVEI